jgi:Lrp/AsnC family leucine-responsive transcriptional regulator
MNIPPPSASSGSGGSPPDDGDHDTRSAPHIVAGDAETTDRAAPARGRAPRDHTADAGNGVRRRAKVRFDDIDIAIIDQLQHDSKITNAKLAKRVGISPPSTLERVKKLEQSGIITGYVARIDPAAVGKSMSAIVSITLREHGEDRLREFARSVAALDEVRGVYHTAGDEDFFLRVVVSDMSQYEDFVVRKLSAIANIGRIRTSFCLSVVKEETAVPLDALGDRDDAATAADR